ITAASDPYPCRRIQKVRRTLLRTSGRVYRTLAFDVLHHGKFTSQVLRELSNFCCLPGRAGGSPNGLGVVVLRQNVVNSRFVPTTVLGMEGTPELRHLGLRVSKQLAEDLTSLPGVWVLAYGLLVHRAGT